MVEDKVPYSTPKPVSTAGDPIMKPDTRESETNAHQEGTMESTQQQSTPDEEPVTNSDYDSSDDEELEITVEDRASLRWYFAVVSFLMGVVVASLMGYTFSMHLANLQENRLWFSNIMVSSIFVFKFFIFG